MFRSKWINWKYSLNITPSHSKLWVTRFLHLLTITLILFSVATRLSAGIIEGAVTDFDSGENIPVVSIRVEETSISMATNDDGRYRLRLAPGEYRLKFSHIAHYSETIEVVVTDSTITQDVRLHPSTLLLKGIKAYTRAYDPAQKIILEAIRRKEEILSKIKSYSFDAYVKMVVRDQSKDTNNIFVIIESQIESYWEQPDKYKEILIARRQSANIEGANNMLGIGQLMNFNQNRLDMNGTPIVSPTANDALDYYNYYLLDTIYIDNRPVFHLEIEPKSDAEPLFAGTIDIADSSYEVVGVDVTFNKGFDMPFVDSLVYSQRYAEFEHQFWMPIEIRLAGLVKIPLPGLPPLLFSYTGNPHDYDFNLVHKEKRFDEYVYEVAENADDLDSAQWLTGQVIPLSIDEQNGYKRIDSIKNSPKPLWKTALMIPLGALALATFAEDIFHFNRVEGAYLGGYIDKNDILPGLDLRLKSGWAFKGEVWQHNYESDYYLSNKRRQKFNFGYHKEIVQRPTIIAGPDNNPTITALADKLDPFDYFLEEGIQLGFSTRLLGKTELGFEYEDYLQSSAENSTEFSLFGGSRKHRLNPAIENGHLRAISGNFSWDSRPLMKNKGQIIRLNINSYTKLSAGYEYAGPDFVKNDFHYKKFHFSLFHNQRMFNLGQSSIFLYGGLSDLNLPPQRQFIVDHSGTVFSSPISFKTLGENNFSGSKAGVVYIHHDFGPNLFRLSNLPLIKKIPFSLGLHGGAFWTKFDRADSFQNYPGYMEAEKAYYEVGFSIGKITAFRYRLFFTWQLSDYRTEKFAISLGGDLF